MQNNMIVKLPPRYWSSSQLLLRCLLKVCWCRISSAALPSVKKSSSIVDRVWTQPSLPPCVWASCIHMCQVLVGMWLTGGWYTYCKTQLCLITNSSNAHSLFVEVGWCWFMTPVRIKPKWPIFRELHPKHWKRRCCKIFWSLRYYKAEEGASITWCWFHHLAWRYLQSLFRQVYK